MGLSHMKGNNGKNLRNKPKFINKSPTHIILMVGLFEPLFMENFLPSQISLIHSVYTK